MAYTELDWEPYQDTNEYSQGGYYSDDGIWGLGKKEQVMPASRFQTKGFWGDLFSDIWGTAQAVGSGLLSTASTVATEVVEGVTSGIATGLDTIGANQTAAWLEDLFGPPAPLATGQPARPNVLDFPISVLQQGAGPTLPTGISPNYPTWNQLMPTSTLAQAVPIPGTGGPLTTVTQVIRAKVKATTGKSMSMADMQRVIRSLGPLAFMNGSGLSLQEILYILSVKTHRRGRGISAVDLRRTRSTLRKVKTIRKDMRSFCATR